VHLGDVINSFGQYVATDQDTSNLILSGGVVLPPSLQVVVNGDIIVSGSITTTGDDVGVTFSTQGGKTKGGVPRGGDVWIAPHTSFKVTSDLTFESIDPSKTMHVGTATTAEVSGDSLDFSFQSHGFLQVDAGQNWKIKGGGYADVNLYGYQGVQLDPMQSFVGPNHGSYSIWAGSDLTLSHVNWKAGYVLIYVAQRDSHPVARHLTIEDSTLDQIYRNGNMHIYNDDQVLGQTDINNSTVMQKNPDNAIVNPQAHCDATTVAPPRTCL
jgi:hypothetical protein